MTEPTEALNGGAEDLAEAAPILIVEEDLLTRIAESSSGSCEVTAKPRWMSSRHTGTFALKPQWSPDAVGTPQ